MESPTPSEQQFSISDVRIASTPKGSRWDVCGSGGHIQTIVPTSETGGGPAPFLTPSFCHPHVHLDKCFLLSHAKYADLQVEKGDFAEALNLTNEAKARFGRVDLFERGRALIEESIAFGVTHMRAFVEVDATVQFKCLDAGLELKRWYENKCYIQICVFAQDPIFSYEDGGEHMRSLLQEAVQRPGVEVFGSTPYVEDNGNPIKQMQNIQYAIWLAQNYGLHLDLHIDYNLDPSTQSFVLHALNTLRAQHWPSDWRLPNYRTVVFGHATRLTLFTQQEWWHLAQQIGDLPVSFVGLPTSDIYMMGKPNENEGGGYRVRGTLQVVQMIKKYGLNATFGINNVGNAFTPQGSCDPLNLASTCIGLYQAGTEQDASILLECISSRAKLAIGLQEPGVAPVDIGDVANFVLFSDLDFTTTRPFREKKTISELLYDGGRSEKRAVYYKGRKITA